MKWNKTMMATVVSMSLLSSAHAVQGQGTVTFSGAIIDAPCSINPDSTKQVVELGEVSVAALKAGGISTPRPFQINLENCTFDTASSVTVTFGGAENAQGLLGITGTAKGAGIAISDGTGTVITLGVATARQKLQAGNNTLSFAAWLKGDGTTATPGEFQSIADFTLAYH